MLGRKYTVSSRVVGGRHLGTGFGFPTVNQHFFEGAAPPRFGVYASSTVVDGELYPSVTNVGIRPTVSNGGDEPTCETHIINYSGDLYGKNVSVILNSFLSPYQPPWWLVCYSGYQLTSHGWDPPQFRDPGTCHLQEGTQISQWGGTVLTPTFTQA